MRRWASSEVVWGLGLLLGLLAASGRSARAQTPPATPQAASPQPARAPEAAESAEYRELVDSAVAEYERGNWTEAYGMFVRAHAIDPSARTLRGLAVCAFEAKQYLRAIESMQAALVDARKPLSEEQRGQATTLIARARVFLGRVEIAIEPSAARIEVDSVPAVRDEQGRVLLDPGPHELTFSHPGHVTETRAVRINPGDEPSLVVALAASLPATSVGPQSAPAPDTKLTLGASPPKADHDAGTRRVWAWVGAAGGLVFAGAGTTMFVLGRDGVSDVESACPPDTCSSDEIDRLIDDEGLVMLQAGSITAFVLAGASAIVSAVLFASDGGEPSVEHGTAPSPLRGRF